MHQELANATFRMECGTSSGSGFSFRDETTIVTNHHVIENFFLHNTPIYAVTENGEKLNVCLESYSDKSKFDFAILKLIDPLPPGRRILQPDESGDIFRGRKVMFAGFPHGIHDLLIHEAIISGPLETHAFYLDGSVNGGNSGGPIIDAETGLVVGVVTQRRFLGGNDLKELEQPISELITYFREMKGTGVIMNINFSEFTYFIANSIGAIKDALSVNANTGIGIGFKIEFVNSEYQNPSSKQVSLSRVTRNSECPCGSGKRYKDCCGRLSQ